LRAFLLAAAVPLSFSAALAGVGEKEYESRRAAVESALDSAGVAVFRAADMKMRSADVEYRYRQESNLLYLTGINEPGVTLVLAGRRVAFDGAASSRFLVAGREVKASLARSQALRDAALLDADRLQDLLQAVLKGARTLYLSMPDVRFVNDWLNNRPLFLDRDVRKELERRFEGLTVKSASPLVSPLRERKSAAEIDLIRKAIAATGDGIVKAMQASGPGVFEYELQGALEGEMMRQGAAYTGFPSIIGSGPNSLIVHYSQNRRKMESGEMVVMDVGAEMEGYSADVTRSFPVNGKFSVEQRAVYEAVLEAQKEAVAAVRPGRAFGELERLVKDALTRKGFGKYLTHGISHHVGLDVHDVGRLDTLRAGMVVTIEPGAYIPASDTVLAQGYRGWGIRIEDDVLVTDGGNVVLSSRVPKEIDEIERIMKK
jgi:Xaa-Pro aminopeptidase